MKRRILIFLATAGLTACVPSLSKEEYQKWLTANKETLTARASCGPTNFTLEYIPAALTAQRAGSDDPDTFKEEFIFQAEQTVLTTGFVESFQIYADMYMPEDFVLIQGRDSLPCMAAQTVNSSLAAVSRQMILLFDGKLLRNGNAVKVLYKDQVFGCKSPVLFEFKELDIRKLPNLK